jgi:hypothetical protein
MAQAVSHQPLTAEDVGFMVDKVALGQVSLPKYFRFPLSISFHQCSITRKNRKNYSSSSQGCTRLWWVRSICCGALRHKKKKKTWHERKAHTNHKKQG